MAITFECEGCGKTLKVSDEMAGRRGRCPHCKTIIQVPDDCPVLATVADDEVDEDDDSSTTPGDGNEFGDEDAINDADEVDDEGMPSEEAEDEQADNLSGLVQTFDMLSDETRLGILCELCDGSRSVGSICDILQLPQPTVSHHLALLRNTRLVKSTRSGKQKIYSINRDEFKDVAEVLQKMLLI